MKKTITPLIPSWIHSLNDYQRMFDLQQKDLAKTILDYPASVSSFNAEMYRAGFKKVVSADTHYDMPPLDMAKQVDTIVQQLATQISHYADRLQLTENGKTMEDIFNEWHHCAKLFLSDYSAGKLARRYRVAKLPNLPFDDFQFELALCPDLLFREEHAKPEQTIQELCRVAHEVRVFPLLNDQGEITAQLGPAMLALQNKNYGIEIREVPYKLLKGHNAMLRVWAKTCVVYK